MLLINYILFYCTILSYYENMYADSKQFEQMFFENMIS